MGTRYRAIWGAAVLATAVLVLVVLLPAAGRGQVSDAIDVTGDVDASQCAPCHLRIAEAQKPGLIFTHGNHLMVGCSACHIGNPHLGGRTVSPPMEVCFNCHGVAHGPQGDLAAAECSACHTRSFPLRPKGHVKDWEAKPHAERAKLGVNSCMMCHQASRDCDGCHQREKVEVGKMPRTYLPIYKMRPRQPAIEVYPDRPTSMGQCIQCHPDIDDFMPGKVIFEHAEHLRRNYQCTVCHPAFGHGNEEIRRPDMRSCYRCHGLTHAAGGLVATEDCGKCHPKSFKLKPSDHTKPFEAGQHKVHANKDPAYCAMCHQAEFCVKCHMGRKKLKDGTYSRPVVPADHKRATWRGKHGTLFLEQKGACGSCHDSPSCTGCHQTPMPHPADWIQGHSKAKGIENADCNVCHTDRERCQACHHDRLKRAQLIASNCTPCHEEMKAKEPTKLKNKGFAEHAVHFNVHKEKGKPYTCDDCHIGFGTRQTSHDSELADAGHDVRLCYGCHGALDYQNHLIAPYTGAQLCLRCHSDLNI